MAARRAQRRELAALRLREAQRSNEGPTRRTSTTPPRRVAEARGAVPERPGRTPPPLPTVAASSTMPDLYSEAWYAAREARASARQPDSERQPEPEQRLLSEMEDAGAQKEAELSALAEENQSLSQVWHARDETDIIKFLVAVFSARFFSWAVSLHDG